MKVLVVCTGNSCRSQMAEAFLNQMEGVEAKSAGTHPEVVNPNAVAVMEEVGIDIGLKASNHVDEFANEEFDYVITVCDHAGHNCPVFPGAGQRIHESFEDPAKATEANEDVLDKFREVRDLIRLYVSRFVVENN